MFYFYGQNNSGGRYVGATYIIIEADSGEEANQRAEEEAGIYFDGVSDGKDCACCGNRWSRLDDSDGTEVPKVHSTPVRIIQPGEPGNGDSILIYKDGRRVEFEVEW